MASPSCSPLVDIAAERRRGASASERAEEEDERDWRARVRGGVGASAWIDEGEVRRM
jgi:hypothetical protein